MKKLNAFIFTLTFTTILLAGGFKAIAQDVASKAKITFESTEYDFKEITQGDNGEVEFKFKNTGQDPLVLSKVHGCCGVSVTEWTQSPVAPGGSGSIKVKYNTGRVGVINKTITVYSNDESSPTLGLKLKGNVKVKEETTAD